MDCKRGKIYSLPHYLRGKRLDHSGWANLLPRRITPSDVDVIFDNNGELLAVELNSKTDCWAALARGQRLTYENLVRAGGGKIRAALARHTDVPEIDTTKDIESFQLMRLVDGELVTSRVFPGKYWVAFVQQFFACAPRTS